MNPLSLSRVSSAFLCERSLRSSAFKARAVFQTSRSSNRSIVAMLLSPLHVRKLNVQRLGLPSPVLHNVPTFNESATFNVPTFNLQRICNVSTCNESATCQPATDSCNGFLQRANVPTFNVQRVNFQRATCQPATDSCNVPTCNVPTCFLFFLCVLCVLCARIFILV